MDKLRLHLAETQDFSKEVLTALKENFSLTSGAVKTEELAYLLTQVDVFWFRLGYRIDADVLGTQTRCKYLVSPVTGIDHIDESLCAQLNIRIICLRGEIAFLREVRATAEHTILLTLALLRHLAPALQDVNSGGWNRDDFRGREIYKKTIGIVGLGRLGRITADYFLALGASVLYYDPEPKEQDHGLIACHSLEKCIEQSDIVSIHVPYNEDTHHLFDAQLLRNFRADQYLINTSRGGVIDEQALLEVLRTNKIGGVALDVLQGEPDIAEHALVEYAAGHNNLLISPHIGGCTYESFAKTESFVYDKLLNAISEVTAR